MKRPRNKFLVHLHFEKIYTMIGTAIQLFARVQGAITRRKRLIYVVPEGAEFIVEFVLCPVPNHFCHSCFHESLRGLVLFLL
jgi:hypothetical protein